MEARKISLRAPPSVVRPPTIPTTTSTSPQSGSSHNTRIAGTNFMSTPLLFLESAGYPVNQHTSLSTRGAQVKAIFVPTGVSGAISTTLWDPNYDWPVRSEQHAWDSIVWVKDEGELDGTSNATSSRFDAMCVTPVAQVPAPEAGQWFNINAHAVGLVKDANPPLDLTSFSAMFSVLFCFVF